MFRLFAQYLRSRARQLMNTKIVFYVRTFRSVCKWQRAMYDLSKRPNDLQVLKAYADAWEALQDAGNGKLGS